MEQSSPQSPRVVSLALMVVGIVIAAFAILADTINIGSGKGFGYYQMIVLIAGIIIFLIGVAVIVSRRGAHEDSHDPSSDSA